MKKITVYLIPALVLTVGAVSMVLFLGMREDQPRRAPEPRVRMVETRVVEFGPVATDLPAFGTVVSAQPVELFAEVAGSIQAGDVPFRPGQAFRKGDILVRIDDRQVELDRRSAISELLTALANFLPEAKTRFPDEYPTWQTYFDRIDFDSRLPEIPEVTDRRIKLYLSRLNVYKLYFAVKDIEVRQEKHRIRAIFDGAIISAELRPGSTARAGSRLGSLVNLEDLEVEVSLAAQDVPWVDVDRPVSFTSTEFEGRWEGRVSRVGQAIDTRTQTVPLYVELERGPTRLLPEGVFLGADVPGRVIDSAFEIPRRAIYDDRFVYLITEGRLERRPVDVARVLHESIVIDGGLKNGDTLVVEPLQGAVIGTPVQAKTTTDADWTP